MPVNSFGVEIPDRVFAVNAPGCGSLIRQGMIESVLLGDDRTLEERSRFVDIFFDLVNRVKDDFEFEASTFELFKKEFAPVVQKNPMALALTRTHHMAGLIVPHLNRGATLDFGSGAGFLGETIDFRHRGVTLSEIYQSPEIEKRGLPFVLLPKSGPLPFQTAQFDNVLACVVLHHCNDPRAILAEFVRILKPGGRLIVVESVYGLTPEEQSKTPKNDFSRRFFDLDIKEQSAYIGFCDYIGNRCTHYTPDPEKKTPVPYNYLTPSMWRHLIEDVGFKFEFMQPLGIDFFNRKSHIFHSLMTAIK